MHRRNNRIVAIAVAAMAVTLGLVGRAGAGPAREGFAHHALVRANSQSALPQRGGTVDSLNWSGYAVTPAGGGVTAVTSTFVVPKAGLLPPGFAATWTGIGGYSTGDIIQAGTSEQSLPTLPLVGPQYFAWYELLPAAETPLTGCTGDASCAITPGDRMTVAIKLASGSHWHIAMSDAGKWTWGLNVTYGSSESSAEWILEAPTLVAQTLLAPVGTTSFGPTSTYTARGVTHTIAQGDPTRIVLTPGLITEASPSAIASNGQSFEVCAYKPACSAP